MYKHFDVGLGSRAMIGSESKREGLTGETGETDRIR